MQSSLFNSSVVPFRLVFFMWAAFYAEFFWGWQLHYFGIHPRDISISGLIGIAAAPMLHGGLNHLVSNTIPLLFLGTVLFFFYEKIGGVVFFRAYFWTNILVWIFGRYGTNHIGASGVVYGLAFFLIFFGIFRRDFTSLLISIVVVIMYGGVIYGVMPFDPEISWESHLAGGIVGLYTAIDLGKKRRVE